MTENPTRLVVVDPRTFDGDPFDVASRACAQAEGVAAVLVQCIETANLMVRNAELERQLQAGDEPDPDAYELSALGRTVGELSTAAVTLQKRLHTTGIAAGFNPKART